MKDVTREVVAALLQVADGLDLAAVGLRVKPRGALLLDGNIGIGGAPDALLARLRELLRSGGEVLVELAQPAGAVTREQTRPECDGLHSRSFARALRRHRRDRSAGTHAGFAGAERWQYERRWFARLVCAR